MANGFRVEASSLQQGIGQLMQLNEQFKGVMTNLQSDTQTLSGQWEGEAKNKFNASMNNDIATMSKFYTTIQQYIQALTEIGNKYNTTEHTNVGLIH